MDMQNRKQLATDYFETQNINKQNRFGDYAEKKKQHEKDALFQYGSEGRPTRLTSSELDPVTGQITWPIALEAPAFAQFTKPIDEAFVKRAETKSRLSYQSSSEVIGLWSPLVEFGFAPRHFLVRRDSFNPFSLLGSKPKKYRGSRGRGQYY